MKELSAQLHLNPPKTNIQSQTALELGILKPGEYSSDAISSFESSKGRYHDLLRAIHGLFHVKLESQEFEDKCRSLFGTSAYLMFTVDKLIQAIIKQIQAIQSDPRSLDLVALYFKDCEKPSITSRQEAVYRLNAEGLTLDEPLYKLEYVGFFFGIYHIIYY